MSLWNTPTTHATPTAPNIISARKRIVELSTSSSHNAATSTITATIGIRNFLYTMYRNPTNMNGAANTCMAT